MDDNVRRTLKAFETLTPSQREELLKSLRGYETKGRLDESVRKDLIITMGPLGGRCPYCGK